MIATLRPWLEFAIYAATIGYAAPMLVRYGGTIARRTGVSRSWIGLVLLSTATSLPELFTGLSAVTVADAPNIAVGDVLGSCVFNLLILVALDALSRGESIYRRVEQGHVLIAGFGIILIGTVGALLIVARETPDLRLLHVSAYTPLMIVLYFVAMRAAYVYEHRVAATPRSAADDGDVSLRTALLRYAVAAAVVIAAGARLPFIGVEIADAMGWRTTFVGTLLIAGATSAGELVVSISAFRAGAVDMAIANLLGSNLFDIFVLAADDIAYTKGPLLALASPTHAVSAFAAIIMSGVFVVAVLYQPQGRVRGTVGWASLSLLLIYLLSAYVVYLHGH